MFEKEAKITFKKKATKIAEKKVKEFYKECGWKDYKYMIPEFADVGAKCMQKGAEFGYNKAKTETALLSQHILDLQKDKGNLTDRVRELEQQIEKMKCCGNCIHCKYDENEESYEFCEKHQQVVNIAIVPCSEYERR